MNFQKIAKALIKIAQQLEQFTGSEAHLYKKDIKQSINESKNKVMNTYNNSNKEK